MVYIGEVVGWSWKFNSKN